MSEPKVGEAAEALAEAKVLIVDDEEPILRALQRELRGQLLSITACNDPHSALEAVKRERFALIITDNRMPGMTGIELLEQVKRISPETSRILLTGYTDLDSAVRAINDGEINFFIAKPWEREQLLERVAQGLEKHRQRVQIQQLTQDLEERNKILSLSNEQLKNLAVRDQMTGLYNHAQFQNDLARQIKLFRRDHQPFCLAMGDIDNFKRINDTHGHPAGDAVIKSIAQILQTALREEVDSSYRYGGEEFTIIMRNTTEEPGGVVMTRVIARVAQSRVPIPGNELSVTMSFGVGQFDPAWSAEELLQRVDQALYSAKHGGKNRVARVSTLPMSGKE
jgi:diguanylate cyclase (GGDEF)-like protein